MKVNILHFATIVLASIFISCEKNQPIDSENTIDVRLSLNGDVEFIDEPMTKAWGESNSVYGIKVYVYNENVNSYDPYAYGIFTSASNLSITLTTTKKYKFEAAYLKDFTNTYSFIDSNQYRAFTEPTNGFVYGSNYFFPYLWGYFSTSNSKKTDFIESDFYYGSIADYVPSSTCSITLYRKSFGIDLTIEGMKEGRVECLLSTMKGANYFMDLSVAYPQTTVSKIYSHKDFISTNTQEWYLEINYISPSSNKTSIASEKLSFATGTRKKILVKLKSNEPVETSNQVSISLSDGGLSDEQLEYQGTI